MMRAAVLAAFAGVALATCPNQCSGHGWCDENDRCICFRAPGTANQHLAYIGADCSQRVCPYGTTHDLINDHTQELVPIWSSNDEDGKFVGFIGTGEPKLKAFLNQGFLLERDLGLDVRVVEVKAGIKFQYKFSNQKTFGPEVTAKPQVQYTTRETAYHVDNSGLYIYFDISTDAELIGVKANDRYFLNVTFNDGTVFNNNDPNTAHQLVECSGRGNCDRTTGNCACVDGYTGDACQRTVCPHDCSGHGICQSEKYFVEDALHSYNAFDAETAFGCKCDRGFRGADCSQRECPSGADPMKGDGAEEGADCSGRGLCDYTTGLCKCFKGFYGERCEELTTLV